MHYWHSNSLQHRVGEALAQNDIRYCPIKAAGMSFICSCIAKGRNEDPAGAHDTHNEERTAHQRRRILIIEDNCDAAETLQMLLEIDGHLVEVAHTGPEGLGRAQASCPDVVICDIGLPLMDGYEIARRIRAAPDLCSIILIALTGYALPEDVRKSTEAGFNYHLPKPPDLDRLKQIITDFS